MKTKKLIIGLLAVILILGILDLTWKIRYSEEEYFQLTNLELNDSIKIKSGQAFIGKNILGEIEAIVFPDQEEVEYVYMRFYPEWFNENLNTVISKAKEKPDKDLLSEVKRIHELNFKSYMHINDYPIIKKDFVPFAIKTRNDDHLKRYVYNIKTAK